MIRMTNPLFGTGKAVVMDGGLCVMKGIVGMLAHGVYGTKGIKKNDIVPSTSRDIPLMHASDKIRLGVFMIFVVIWMGKSTR